MQGVVTRADGGGDDDGGERRGRGSALIHAQDGHQGGHDDEAPAHSEKAGKESCANTCRDDEENATHGEGLVVGVGHASTVVLRCFAFWDGASLPHETRVHALFTGPREGVDSSHQRKEMRWPTF